jgi:hypothetical protein
MCFVNAGKVILVNTLNQCTYQKNRLKLTFLHICNVDSFQPFHEKNQQKFPNLNVRNTVFQK